MTLPHLAHVEPQYGLSILVGARRSRHDHVEAMRHGLLHSRGAGEGYAPEDGDVNPAVDLSSMTNFVVSEGKECKIESGVW